MVNEVDNLEKFIRINFDRKEDFANALGVTRQTVNNIIRGSVDGVLPSDFKMRLRDKGFDIFQNVQQKPPKMVKVDGEYIARSHYKIRGDGKHEKTVEPPLEIPKPQPTLTVDKLATALLTANESVNKLTDSVKANAASMDTLVNTNAQLATHVMQHTKPLSSDELKLMTAMRIFLHKHVIEKGVMDLEGVRKELSTLIDAHGKASSIVYNFGI